MGPLRGQTKLSPKELRGRRYVAVLRREREATRSTSFPIFYNTRRTRLYRASNVLDHMKASERSNSVFLSVQSCVGSDCKNMMMLCRLWRRWHWSSERLNVGWRRQKGSGREERERSAAEYVNRRPWNAPESPSPAAARSTLRGRRGRHRGGIRRKRLLLRPELGRKRRWRGEREKTKLVSK